MPSRPPGQAHWHSPSTLFLALPVNSLKYIKKSHKYRFYVAM
jgi:hypothetical protein